MPTRLRRWIDRLLGRGGRLPKRLQDWDTYSLDDLMDGPEDEGRRLASWRDDLIAEGHDPAELAEPIHPDDLAQRLRVVMTKYGLAAWDRSGPATLTRAPISETHYELRSWVQGLTTDADGRLRRDGQWRLQGQFIIHEPGWQEDQDGAEGQPEITWGGPGSGL
jgi:hypothetical protein